MSLFVELDRMDELNDKIHNLNRIIAMVNTTEISEELSKELDDAYQELDQAYKRIFTTSRTRSQ
ncbi:hypothetical protein [Balneatrix alpica]|uniref:Uncharacterized protein n=1 Tax=Balneatrix alpica TaxID=75684 RepID=A0ABV5ZFB8_9GAMM|nr:hypothetical protein [Balneatrix alpica]